MAYFTEKYGRGQIEQQRILVVKCCSKVLRQAETRMLGRWGGTLGSVMIERGGMATKQKREDLD